MKNIFNTDWHIHTEASYDATLTLAELIKRAGETGITEFGVTEHVNYPFNIAHLQRSGAALKKIRREMPDLKIHLGVELSPNSNFAQTYTLSKEWDPDTPLFYGMIKEFLPGYGGIPELVEKSNEEAKPYLLSLTEEQLRENRVEYVVAAVHYVLNNGVPKREEIIKNWHEQQMLCATDSRVDIVGHPWWVPWNWKIQCIDTERGAYPRELSWVDDFSVIPQSMHDEFAAALIENDKRAEMNISFYTSDWFSETAKYQYAEYLRGLFEKGIGITAGTDSHDVYEPQQKICAKYLSAAGFKAGDFTKPKFREYE